MISYHILQNSIIVNHDNQTLSIENTDDIYYQALDLIKQNRPEEIISLFKDIDPANYISDGFYIKNNVIYDQYDNPVNESITKKIINFMKEDIPFEYLLNFYRKLQNNPSENSKRQLYNFLEYNHFPITSDGNFIAYKAITKGFKDIYSRTLDYSIGNIVNLSRNLIDDDPNTACGTGLHVGSFKYATGYRGSDGILVNVEVNPEHVVSVPNDCQHQKCRVCELKVLGINKGFHKYHIAINSTIINNVHYLISKQNDIPPGFKLLTKSRIPKFFEGKIVYRHESDYYLPELNEVFTVQKPKPVKISDKRRDKLLKTYKKTRVKRFEGATYKDPESNKRYLVVTPGDNLTYEYL